MERNVEENIKGSIAPGKLADFVVLEKDPRRVPSDTIKDIVLEATYLGRGGVYTAPTKAVAMVPQPPLNDGDGRSLARKQKLANELKLG